MEDRLEKGGNRNKDISSFESYYTHTEEELWEQKTQKKNNYLNSWVDGDTTGDIETK